MPAFDPSVFFSDEYLKGANILEVTLLPSAGHAPVSSVHTDGMDTISIALERPPSLIPRHWRRTQQRIVDYAHKHMQYSYDVANDAQRNTVRTTLQDSILPGYYVRAVLEDVLPCHQFPCTSEIQHTSHVERSIYSVGHNRIQFIVDKVHDSAGNGCSTAPYYTASFRYNHADHAERTKMMALMQEALASVRL